MQATFQNTIQTSDDRGHIHQVSLKPTDDYADVLKYFGLKYKRTDYYLEVGEPAWVQGWILDISIIQSQFLHIQEIVIPLLIQENVPFKIARSERKAHSIIGGELGWLRLGKFICIYPSDGKFASKLAKQLIGRTSDCKGPDIPTDRQLGGVIYTRYGAGKPIVIPDASGKEEHFIYDKRGRLIKDIQTRPFELPKGIEWPFADIASHKAPKSDTVLQDRYKPMYLLKEDPKGSVRKGLWLKKFYQIKWCVIKEGKQNMVSDLEGRDMVDRLRWQYELYKALGAILPMPEIYDYFAENGNAYLAMDYISGVSFRKIIEDAFYSNSWYTLELDKRLRILRYTIQILDIISTMHKSGYVHRDITTNNFLIDKNEKIWLIDLELSYCLAREKSLPPFRLGTSGYMSPEQEKAAKPTVEQDFYALGAVLLFALTGLSPHCFAEEDVCIAKQQISFFLDDPDLVELITNCFNLEPALRPNIPTIKDALLVFLESQVKPENNIILDKVASSPEKLHLRPFIDKAIKGLVIPKMVNIQNLWVSKASVRDEPSPYGIQPVEIYENFSEGASGIVWVLAKAHDLGFALGPVLEYYEANLTFARKLSGRETGSISGGLFLGSAGVAMSMVEGIRSRLIPNNEEIKTEIISLLTNSNLQGPGIAFGLAGQGIVLIQTLPLIGPELIMPLLSQNMATILEQQQLDGSWTVSTTSNKTPIKPTGFAQGIAGIICYLLSYLKLVGDDAKVKQAAERGLQWLIGQAHKSTETIRWTTHAKSDRYSRDFQDGSLGIILCLIKAYEVLRNVKYKEVAENSIRRFAKFGINSNLTFSEGLIGYGEVVLEGLKVFGDLDWQERTHWVAMHILHYFKQDKKGVCYWLTDGSNEPTAEFLNGNSGIIHFLLRYYQPGKLSPPMVPF